MSEGGTGKKWKHDKKAVWRIAKMCQTAFVFIAGDCIEGIFLQIMIQILIYLRSIR